MKMNQVRAIAGRLGVCGLVLLSASTGACCAIAETHTSSGSTSVVQQSGGGVSQSQVTRHRDGQTVVTRDGRSTDISIQRGPGPSSPTTSDALDRALVERFDRPSSKERFRSGFPADQAGVEDFNRQQGSSQDAFRQQMLERMRAYP
jgi:hypothetical protein